MSTQMIESIRYSSGSRRIVEYPETASQTFKKGQFVEMDTDGRILEVSSGDVIILGLAMADASGVTANMIPVLIAQDDTEFTGNIYHATAASAITANTDKDTKWAYYTTGNIGYVNIGDSSGNDALMITEILVDSGNSGKQIGDTYGRVKFVVLPEVQQLGATGT